jgi:hypothetical protein
VIGDPPIVIGDPPIVIGDPPIVIVDSPIVIGDPPRPSRSPIGSVERAQGIVGGFIGVSGWMLDPDAPTKAGQVHVYIDGRAGSGARVVRIGAALSRPDVARLQPKAGPNHGFSTNTAINDVAPGRHTLYFYGINVAGGGSNVLLATKTATVPAMSGPILPAGGVLSPDNSLTSTDGRYRLTMQGDGNLVERVTATGRVLWNSGTAGNGGARLVMRPDGNAVIYNRAGRAAWSTSGGTGNGSRLALQPDANLVIYNGARAVWATYTKNDRLVPGEVLKAGQWIRSVNGAYTLSMQSDGNLVLYNNLGKALWSTRTQGHPNAWAVSQSDGNFVVYQGTKAWWNTQTGGKTSGGTMIMQGDGNLVLYRGVWIWASRTAR